MKRSSNNLQTNERTFLAWLRASIALIGFGFALTRFGLFLQQLRVAIIHQETPPNLIFNSENLGVSLVVFGIAAIVLAAWRYNQVFWQIEHGDYRPNRFAVWIMTGTVIILGILSIPLLLIRNQEITAPVSPPKNLKSKQ